MQGNVLSYKRYWLSVSGHEIATVDEVIYTPHHTERNNFPPDITVLHRGSGESILQPGPLPSGKLRYMNLPEIEDNIKEVPVQLYATFWNKVARSFAERDERIERKERIWLFHLIELDECNQDASYLVTADPDMTYIPGPQNVLYPGQVKNRFTERRYEQESCCTLSVPRELFEIEKDSLIQQWL